MVSMICFSQGHFEQYSWTICLELEQPASCEAWRVGMVCAWISHLNSLGGWLALSLYITIISIETSYCSPGFVAPFAFTRDDCRLAHMHFQVLRSHTTFNDISISRAW